MPKRAERVDRRRRELVAEAESYLADLIDDVGEPPAEAFARAEELSRVIRRDDDYG